MLYVSLDGNKERQMYRRIDRQIDRLKDYRQIKRQIEIKKDRCIEEEIDRFERQIEGWKDRQIDGWKERYIDG